MYMFIEFEVVGLLDHDNYHLSKKVEKYKNYIIFENKGLNREQFKKKYGIEDPTHYEVEPDVVDYNLLYFKFKDGALYDIE